MEVESKTVLWILGGITSAIACVYAWVAKHILNYDRHSSAKDIKEKLKNVITTPFCNERHRNVDRNLEIAVGMSEKQHEHTRTMVTQLHEDMKLFIRNGGK